MQLSHARDQRLAYLAVRRDSERRVLLCQFMECDSQFFPVRLRLRRDGYREDGLRESYGLQNDRSGF
jgi:hypothetical protein